MGQSKSKPATPGLKVPSIILEENVVRHFLTPHLVDGRIPTPIEEGAFIAALEALTAVEPRMRHYSSSFRTRSLIKACDDFHDRLYAVYYASYDEYSAQTELRYNDSSDSIMPCEPPGARDEQIPVSASSSTALPCLTTSAVTTTTCTAEQAKQGGERGEQDATVAEDSDHVCAKVQSLESKVARLERTVSLLTKMVERKQSRQRRDAPKADPVTAPDAHAP